MPIIIKAELFPQDHKCPAIGPCPVQAISQGGFNAPIIDQEKMHKLQTLRKNMPKIRHNHKRPLGELK